MKIRSSHTCSLSTLSMPSRTLYVAICTPSCRPRGCALSPHKAAPSPSGHPGCHKLRHLPPPVIHSTFVIQTLLLLPLFQVRKILKSLLAQSKIKKKKKKTFFLALSSLAIFLNGIYTSFVSHPLLSPYHMPSQRLLKAFSPSRWVILLVRPFCPSHTTDHTLILSCLFPRGYWFLSFLFSISVMVSYH